MPNTNPWSNVPLGELASFRNGINYNKENFGHGLKVINVRDFHDYSKPRYDELEEINPKGVVRDEHLLRESDIIFVRSNGNRELIGRSLFCDRMSEKVTHSAFSIRLRFHSPDVFPRFYAYLFRSGLIRNVLSAQGSGTNICNLNQDILGSLRVPLPPLPTQRKIAAVLSAYDDLIENNTRRIQILEEMARALYREWFVEFRFPGHEHIEVEETVLGPLPRGWCWERFAQLLADHIGGGWGSDRPSDEYPLPAHVIRGTDIPGARIGQTDSCPLRYHKPSNLRTRKIGAGDIVFEVSGGSKGQPVGRALLVNERLLRKFGGDVICASFCKLLRMSDVAHSEFVYLNLDHIYRNGTIDKYQVQSTGITNFRFAVFLEDHKVPLPPRDLMDQFTEAAASLLDGISALGRQNDNLRRTRDLLLPKLVSGEIDVSELDIPVPEAVE